jgi:hypothetical protein
VTHSRYCGGGSARQWSGLRAVLRDRETDTTMHLFSFSYLNLSTYSFFDIYFHLQATFANTIGMRTSCTVRPVTGTTSNT